MTYATSSRLAHWISMLSVAAAIPLSGCGNSELPSGSSGSSGPDVPSCPKDASPASQLVTAAPVEGVAATTESLYFIAPGFGFKGMHRLPLAGGAAEYLGQIGSAHTLLAEGDHLYNVAGGTFKIDFEVAFLAPENVDYLDVALDETSYYILAQQAPQYTHSIVRAPRSGGEPTKVANLPSGVPRTIAADGSAVYAVIQLDGPSSEVVIARAPLDGSSVTTVATGVIPARIAVDATSLYYFGVSASSNMVELLRSNKTGGGVTVLLSGLSGPYDLLLADDLYVLDQGSPDTGGRLQRISTRGDCGQVLATAQPLDPELFMYSHIAANATDVFWATKEGIGRVTR